jgi:precorrin-2 dehydrogenase/sirohydrochlorin ferrochelatase
MAGYLIELELRGKLALVVGLGSVGRRKARGLVEAEARVLAVDPGPTDPAPDGVELRAEPYRPGHLDGIALVFAAATAEVNRRVVADARERALWVNAASEPGSGDFRVPATWRDGPVTLAVSTSGASPALAATLRDRAASALGPRAAELAILLARLRPEILVRIPDPTARRRILAAIADPSWLDRLAVEGAEATREALREMLGW